MGALEAGDAAVAVMQRQRFGRSAGWSEPQANRADPGAPGVDSAPRPAWWIDPTWVLLAVCLPVLLITLAEGPAGLIYFKNYIDNYTPDNRTLAVAAFLALTCGTIAVRVFPASPSGSGSFDPSRVGRVLRWLGVAALAAYVLLLGPWLIDPDIAKQVLEGGGADAAKQAMNRLPGITSFTNVAPVFCALWAAARLDPRFRPTLDLKCIFAGLVLVTLARAFVGSERLALIEFVMPLILAPAAFRWRPSLVRAAMPLIGLVALIAFFAVAEYVRSWRYYQFQVGSGFWEFMLLRLAGYYATALNNGMGMFEFYGPLNVPFFSAQAITKLPIWSLFGPQGDSVTENSWGIYLLQVGNPEFNNLSGLFAPLVDFGPGIGVAALCAIGMMVGLTYRSFVHKRIAGLLLYPTCYIAILEIIRLFYLGQTRNVPVLLSAGLAAWALRYRPVRRLRGGDAVILQSDALR